MSMKQLESRINNGKDTTYIVNLWATWCAPCIEELPYFEKINDIYKSEKIKIILWSLDFKSKLETDVKSFVGKNNIKSEVFVVNEKSQQDFIDKISEKWSGAIPATLVLQPSTKRRDFFEREFTYLELEELVKSYIKK